MCGQGAIISGLNQGVILFRRLLDEQSERRCESPDILFADAFLSSEIG